MARSAVAYRWGMHSSPRRFAVVSLSAALLLGACGSADEQQTGLSAKADQLAQLAANGDDCEAQALAGDLAAQLDSAEQLPADSRDDVRAFLRTLVDELQCEPTPDEESEDQEDDESEKDDKPGKGKGRDKGRDD